MIAFSQFTHFIVYSKEHPVYHYSHCKSICHHFQFLG